ncbi:UDP-N-acetylmuramoyl-L-alanyl-D-glutamate--2,6-diaminopimelate ligase [Streptomyces alboniger]
MTTITPDSGNQATARPSLRSEAGAPGTLTAVPHPDQPQNTQKGAPVTYQGPPRPVQVSATPLAELADQLGAEKPTGPAGAAEVTGITHDSRAVRPGDLYAALPGARLHGADFVTQAAGLGAVAVLTDPTGAERATATGLPVLAVADPRALMGELAATIYGHPGRDLLQIGITGTSGKTTTAYLVEGGLRTARATGLIGTVETRIGDERIKSERTTPEATDLQALFAVMRERGVEAVAMEVSSHALVLGRLDACVFDLGVFTNLSPEHMEFHSDMEDYFQAKAQLFTPKRSRLGVVNFDDEYGRRLVEEATVPVVTFSAEGHPDADWRAEDVELGPLDSRSPRSAPRRSGSRPARRSPGPSTWPTPSPRSSPSPPPASIRRPPPTASPPCRAYRAALSVWTPGSRISRLSTTPTRPTPSNPSCAPCARSPRGSCTWCSAAAVTGARPSGCRWVPPWPGTPTQPY